MRNDKGRAEGEPSVRVPPTECQKCLHADGVVLSFTHEGVSRSIWCCPFCVYYTEQVLAEARSRSDTTHEWYEHQRARADAIQEQLNREQDRSRGYKNSRDNLSARHGEVCNLLREARAKIRAWPGMPVIVRGLCERIDDALASGDAPQAPPKESP